MSFKSVNSLSLPESGSEPEQPQHISYVESSSFPSLPHSSVPGTFGGLDLFDSPLAPQNVTLIPSTGSNSQLPESSLVQPVSAVQQPPVSTVPTFTEQQPLDLFTELSQPQSAASFNGQASDVVMPNDGGWATFDVPQNLGPMVANNTAPSSDGNVLGNFNPFSIDQSSSYQDHVDHEPSASTHTFAFGNLQSVKTTVTDTNVSITYLN